MNENICKKFLTRIGGNTPKKKGICPPYSSSPLRLLSAKNLLLFLVFLMIFFLSACQCESPTDPDDTDSGIPATNITINGGDFTNNSGASSNLMATVLPSNHTDGDITWSSGDTNILTINSNGDYNALAPGETRITARVGDISNAVTVTVLQPATNIIINGGDFTTTNGLSGNLMATVLPPNHTDGDIAWSSGDTNILTINSNGDYNALAPGETRITARVGDISNAVTVTVLQPATNIIINGGDFTTTNGLSGNLMATVLPPNHTDGAITWSSSSTDALTINSSGNYTAVGWISAMVTARVGEVSNTINVTIKGLNLNITVTNNPTNTTSQVYHLSNHIFSNQYSAVVYYRTNASTYTNIFLSNSYNSNHMDTNVGVSSNTIVASIYFTNMTAVDGTNTTNYTRHTNDTVYLTNIFTNYRTNVVFDYYPSTNTNWANWNFVGANLSYLKMVNYSLSNANLSGANLSNADLSNANLIGVNFTNAMFTIDMNTNASIYMNTNTNLTFLNDAQVNFEGYHYLANLGVRGYVSKDFQRIIGNEVAMSSRFGSFVFISESYAAASSINSGNLNYVYILQNQNGTWTQADRVQGQAPEHQSLGVGYGSSISISGDYLAVGSPGFIVTANDSNVDDGVFIYKRQGGGNWQQTAAIRDANVVRERIDEGDGVVFYHSDSFGASVSISGDYLAIGSHTDDDIGRNSGSVFIYERQSGENWNQVTKLNASDGTNNYGFGRSVSIEGDLSLIAATGRSNGTGAVYVFQRQSGSWVQTNIFTANDGADGDSFGSSVSISGNRAIVGAYYDNDNGNLSGSAYIFERQSNGSWSQTAKLTASDGESGDLFGSSVSISGDHAIVGTDRISKSGGRFINGKAYLFSKEGSSWKETRLIAADGYTNDGFNFGQSVSIHSNTAIIGSRLHLERGTNAGAAYLVKFK